ncbi:MAG TPA: ABC transporter ATP-binding protein [Burkholderiales bacterium]|nr:ABC transporter ATP-binding protein [Burkholderiales bacterium]
MSVILEARRLNKSFGAVTAAADISVGVERDSVVGLIGSNGAGKTTFINMVTGYLAPTSGSIHYGDRDITGMAPREITRLGICRSFQIPQLFDNLSVRENLQVGVGIAARSARAAVDTQGEAGGHPRGEAGEIDTLVERFNLGGYRDQPAGLLPEGVRKLLDIAMAVAGHPNLLLLDEPTSGVSADEKFRLMDMVMGALQAQGVTVLFVEHDMEVVARYTHRILAFYEGRIIADGEPQAVLRDADVRRHVIGEDLHPGRAEAARG